MENSTEVEDRVRYYVATGKMDEAAARALAEKEAKHKQSVTGDLFGEAPKPKKRDLVAELAMRGQGVTLPDSEHRVTAPFEASDPGQLPLWFEERKPVSNLLVRCGVFAPEVRTKKLVSHAGSVADTRRGQLKGYTRTKLETDAVPLGRGTYLETRVFHSWNSKTQVFFSGYRLYQLDLDVLTALLEIIRERQLEGESQGLSAFFSTSTLLEKMGESDRSAKKRREVEESILALHKSQVKVIENGRVYSSQIVSEFAFDPEREQWYVAITAKFRAFFGESNFTRLDWRIRRNLSTGPAKWLHALYSTHAEPGPIGLEALAAVMEADVSDSTKKAKFRDKIRKAFTEIAAAHAAVGKNFSGGIDNLDNVLVSKTPTGSQQRHLSRRKKT